MQENDMAEYKYDDEGNNFHENPDRNPTEVDNVIDNSPDNVNNPGEKPKKGEA